MTERIARKIVDFSLYPSEDEILLPPNVSFEVTSSRNMGHGLTLVQCKQTETLDAILTKAELPAARQTAIDQMSDEISTGLVLVGLMLAMLSVLLWLRTPTHHGLSLDIRRPALPLSVFLLLLVSTAAVAQATTSTVAGMSNAAGNIMAVGTSAKFSAPRGIALSPSADIALLADTNNNNIKHIDLTTWAVTLFAGRADGASGAPLSLSPRPLALPSLAPHALSGSRALSPRPLPRCALPLSPLLPRPRRPVGQRVTV
jgi:hypothetical protein